MFHLLLPKHLDNEGYFSVFLIKMVGFSKFSRFYCAPCLCPLSDIGDHKEVTVLLRKMRLTGLKRPKTFGRAGIRTQFCQLQSQCWLRSSTCLFLHTPADSLFGAGLREFSDPSHWLLPYFDISRDRRSLRKASDICPGWTITCVVTV